MKPADEGTIMLRARFHGEAEAFSAGAELRAGEA